MKIITTYMLHKYVIIFLKYSFKSKVLSNYFLHDTNEVFLLLHCYYFLHIYLRKLSSLYVYYLYELFINFESE